MQEGIRCLLKLKSTGDCPRTNDGAHLIEMPDDDLIEKGRLPWCVQCGLEFNRTEAELLAIVFAATLPVAAVRDALEELRAEALELKRQEESEYTERSALDAATWWLTAVDTTMTALGLGAEGEKR